jgi:threonine/homoserine/homoserine lactone efflux protein
MSLFVQGLLIGFSIAAPVGPIGVLCIRRTLAEGRLYGLVSGLGAATADAFYGVIAGFGLTFVSSFLIAQQTWLRLFGGLFLIYLGIKTLLASPSAVTIEVEENSGLWSAFASTFLLTLTNPLTILSFAAIFAGLGLSAAERSYQDAITLVLGVFLGSAAWWFLLSGGVSLFRSRVTYRSMLWINRIAGLIILGFGLLALLSAGQALDLQRLRWAGPALPTVAGLLYLPHPAGE